jgi:hypothetical protein
MGFSLWYWRLLSIALPHSCPFLCRTSAADLGKAVEKGHQHIVPFDSGMTWVVGWCASTLTTNGRVAYDIDKTFTTIRQKTTMTATTPMQSLSVVRVATSLAGSESDVVLQDFCSAVVGHFASQLSQGGTGSTPAGFVPFLVSNKYFAASIALSYSDIVKVDGSFVVDSPYHELNPEIHPPDSNNDNQATNTEPTKRESSDTTSCPTPDNWHEDGVILLFESFPRTMPAPLLTPQRSVRLTSSSSFNALDSVHERLIQHLPSAGDLLRLCIGVCYGATKSDEMDSATNDAVDKQHEDEYARRILWCLDRGYEYVEVDLSEHGQSQGHDDRDKDGFARVMEAMAGTVWTSAVLKQSRAAPVSHNPTQLERSAASEPHQTDNPHDAAYIPPDPLTCTPMPLSDDDHPSDFPSSTDPDERLMDRFEVALGQAARIRDLSKSGELSDQERRDRAGDAAVLLMNLLGQMGYDDDDDDASGDGSEQDEPSALASECPIDV